MTNAQSEWDRYPSGRSSTEQGAQIAGARRANDIAKALNRGLEDLKFEWTKIGTHFFWRIGPKDDGTGKK